jgi:hypothetical protein
MDVSKLLESIDTLSTQAMTTISNTFDSAGITNDQLATTRMATCVNCPHFVSSSAKCSICGCYMKLKCRLIGAKCPENLW